jgi:hypothetical protein
LSQTAEREPAVWTRGLAKNYDEVEADRGLVQEQDTR